MFFSPPFCVLGKLNTVFIANSNTFPNNRNKMMYACMQFQYSMSLQDCVCGFLLDESDPVGRGLLRCCSLWYTGGHPGTVVWHLCSSHFCGCILRFQKTSEYVCLLQQTNFLSIFQQSTFLIPGILTGADSTLVDTEKFNNQLQILILFRIPIFVFLSISLNQLLLRFPSV